MTKCTICTSCVAIQSPGWSSWPLNVDNDPELASIYGGGVQSSAFVHGHSDSDDVISALYARMIISETGRTTHNDYWPTDGGLSTGRGGSLGVMSASGGSSAETGSFVTGPGGVLADLYDDDGAIDGNDNCWNGAFLGFFDGSLTNRHRLRAGLGAAADDAGSPGGPWRLKPEVGVSAVIGGGGSCGSDGTTSPSCSLAESSSGSAA